MKKFILALLPLLLCYGCIKKDEPIKQKSYLVELGEVVQKDVPIIIEAIGNVYPDQTAEIRSQVTGILMQAFVEEGSIVKKGDPLFQIDPRMYEASLNQAKGQILKDEAILNIAQVIEESYKKLVDKDYVAKLNYEQYVSNVEQAKGTVLVDKANIDSAALNYEWTTIRAPFDGKISQFNVDVGNLVVANDTTALTTLNTLTPADIRFYISQKDFVRVQKAMKDNALIFEVILPQDPLNPRQGSIYFIDNALNLSTGTILIKGYIDNEDQFLWSGEFINVRLRLKVDSEAILVPTDALKLGPDGPYVYVFNDKNSTVEFRLVKKGETLNEMTVIQEGLKKGDKVVTKGQLNLKNGVNVRVREASK